MYGVFLCNLLTFVPGFHILLLLNEMHVIHVFLVLGDQMFCDVFAIIFSTKLSFVCSQVMLKKNIYISVYWHVVCNTFILKKVFAV